MHLVQLSAERKKSRKHGPPWIWFLLIRSVKYIYTGFFLYYLCLTIPGFDSLLWDKKSLHFNVMLWYHTSLLMLHKGPLKPISQSGRSFIWRSLPLIITPRAAKADSCRIWHSCEYSNIIISLWCARPAWNLCVPESVFVFILLLVTFQLKTDLSFTSPYSNHPGFGLDWAYICWTVSLWKAGSVAYSATCSLRDWLFSQRPSSRWRSRA